MKKIQFNFFSAFSFLLVVSIFLVSSCTSSEEVLVDSKQQQEFVIENGYLLPLEISNQTADQIDNHLTNMTAEQELTYINNNIIGQYLSLFGKSIQVYNDLSEKENLSEIDLSGILSTSELVQINSSLLVSLPEIQSRSCSTIYVWSNCCYRDHNGVCVAKWCPNGCYPANCGC